MSPPCLYLYGVIRAGAEIPGDLAGIDGDSPVSAIPGGRLKALVSSTSREGFESDGPADPAWIVPRALQHQHVIDRAYGHGPVMPVRFGALFSSRDAVASWMSLNHDAISRFLDHVADKEEWTLKLEVETALAYETLITKDPAWVERARRLPETVGARYFQEKRLRAEALKHVRLMARATAETVRTAALALAEERILAVRGPDQAGVEPVACLAYLGRREDVERLVHEAQLAALQTPCLKLTASGPWPAAHFCPPLVEN